MIFYASIRKGSVLDRAWRNHGRLSGILEGALFRLEKGIYKTIEPLNVLQIALFQGSDDYQLEIMGKTLGSAGASALAGVAGSATTAAKITKEEFADLTSTPEAEPSILDAAIVNAEMGREFIQDPPPPVKVSKTGKVKAKDSVTKH